MNAPQPIGLFSPDEETDSLDQLFGPPPSRSADRKPIASEVSNEVRSVGGEVIDVQTSPAGILIVGSVSNTVCQLLVCHSTPPHSLSTSIHVVRSLTELRTYLQSL